MTGQTIVVGIDGTPPAQAALAWAARLARATGWGLTAAHVLTWPIGVRDLHGESGDRPRLDPDEVETPYLHGMHRVFAEVDPDPAWRLQFAQGSPGEMLTTLSQGAQLLVIGSREQAAANNYLAGAVSRFCTSHATVPVTVVPVSQR